ncbi:amidohydrolase family protein [Streptomyces sp. NPDC055815]
MSAPDPGSLLSPLPEPYDRLRIDGAFIYTADPDRAVLPDASLLVTGSTIAAVGTSAEVDAAEASLGPAVGRIRHIDASDRMVLPGLVNDHWHDAGAMRAMGGLTVGPDDADTVPGEFAHGTNIEAASVLFNSFPGLLAALPPEVAQVCAIQSLVTQLRSGTTCVADFGSLNTPEALAAAVHATGIRGVVSAYGVDGECRPGEDGFHRTADTDAMLASIERMLTTYGDDPSGRLRAMPSALFGANASDELLLGVAALAERFDTPWGSHVALAANESAASTRHFGARPIERLHRLGVLSSRLISAHTAFADDDEYAWLLDAGVHVTHSPQRYGAAGEGVITTTRQVLRFLADGARISLSSDGFDLPIGGLPESMRMAWLAYGETASNPTVVTPMRALSMASRAGAEALRWSDRIGMLRPGMQADFCTVPIDDYRCVGTNRPLQSFLITGGSSDIDTVVVDGRILVEDRAATFVDEKALNAAFLEAAMGFASAVGADLRPARIKGTPCAS